MKRNSYFRALGLSLLALAALAMDAAAQAQMRAPQPPTAQAPSVCANQPMCAEGYDFAAMITDFRTSAINGVKLIDTTVHFVNKTNRPLILGYADGSAMAIDDQGNRYVINGYAGANAVRGIGKVVGNQIDAKFVLQPGQAGDALFELIWRPTGGAVGQTFEFDFAIREANALEGGQFTLGGEFPLRFLGLTNGVGARPAAGSAYAPAGGTLTATPPAGGAYPAAGEMTATPPAGGAYPAANGMTATAPAGGAYPATPAVATAGCTPGSGLTSLSQVAGNLPAGAQSSVSQAESTIAGLRSIFGRKKKAVAAAAPAAANPCPPGTSPAAPAAAPAAVPAPAPAYIAPAAAAAAAAPAAALAPAPATTAAPAATGVPAAAVTAPNAAVTPAQRVEAVRRARAEAARATQAQTQQRAAQLRAAQLRAAQVRAAQQKAAAEAQQRVAAAQAEARRKAAAEAAAKKKQAATSTGK